MSHLTCFYSCYSLTKLNVYLNSANICDLHWFCIFKQALYRNVVFKNIVSRVVHFRPQSLLSSACPGHSPCPGRPQHLGVPHTHHPDISTPHALGPGHVLGDQMLLSHGKAVSNFFLLLASSPSQALHLLGPHALISPLLMGVVECSMCTNVDLLYKRAYMGWG